MEIFLLVILIIIVLWQGSKLSDKNRQVEYRLNELFKELKQIRSDLESSQPFIEVPPKEKPFPQKPLEKIVPLLKSVLEEPVLPEIVREPVMDKVDTKSLLEEDAFYSTLLKETSKTKPVPPAPQPSFIETFLKNNPDLEKFIGENLINKIGIAILVLGIGYFVKFAIDKEWIGEIGRVGIGILAGGILIGLAHRLRNTFAAFSSVLVGGGLAVLYFTIYIAFHQYHIFSQTAAFVLMVIITGFSILLSVSYNKVELAVLALLGGFVSPFLVSTGQGNYQVLFSYVLILNIGMLILAYLKKWNIINWIAYIFTIILYGGWLGMQFNAVKDPPFRGALVFGTLFYLVFFLMNIINNIKEKTKFTPSEITILLSNTFFYYSASMSILSQIDNGRYQGLFTVAVALFNFGFAFILYKNEKVDRNLIYLLIGLVITFISLAIPVQLQGNYITMFWALEAVLLLWFSQKSGLKLVSASAVIVTGLMLVSLAIDWQQIYSLNTVTNPLPVLVNKAFITSVIAIISLSATIYLLTRQTEPFDFRIFKLEMKGYKQVLNVIWVIVLYLSLLLELNYQLITYVESGLSRTIILGCYNLLFVVSLFLFAQRRGKTDFVTSSAIIGIIGIILYLFVYNPAVMSLLQSHFVNGEKRFIGFPFHYLSLILVLLMLGLIFRNQSIFNKWIPSASRIILWSVCLIVVYIASSELIFHVIYFKSSLVETLTLSPGAVQEASRHFNNLITQTNKVGFPILWGICAFILMFIGLNHKNKDLRIVSLTLFTLTLLKLFIYDIRGISEGGKIAAFISLGVLLLVISFMYQNIKRLILADNTPKTPEE